ncbi:hypothetical protein [Comamonas badia]|uniref:hypothetical protein n=1 Tax=Comamonas badia TaxID=265291 RepID=UPI0006885C95
MPDTARRHRSATTARAALSAMVLVLLAGCDIPGLGPDPRVQAREAEAQAIGGACRHAMRGLEDCYTLNPRSSKASIYAGWKEMDAYMRENKVEGVPSVLTQAPSDAPRAAPDGDEKPPKPASRNRG